MMKKSLKGINALVLSAAIIGIFIVVNIFLGSVSGFEWDLTKNKNFTLSEQTLSTLKGLDQQITMKLFMSSAEDTILTREVEDLAEQYQKESDKITYERYDLYQEPTLAKAYNLASTSIVFELGDKQHIIGLYEMFNIGQATGEYTFTGEEKMTQAIQNLINDQKTKGYVLTGHEEVPLSQMTVLQSSLAQENIELEELNLYEAGAIPDDADLLFIFGASQDISTKELELIEKYLEGDGKLYMNIGFNEEMSDAWPNLTALLSKLGVKHEDAIVVEPQESTLYDPFTIIPQYEEHDVTDKLEEYNKVLLLSLAVPLKQQETSDYEVKSILNTTESAFGETNLKELLSGQGAAQDEQDVEGPFDLAYAITESDGAPKAFVIGSVTYLLDNDIYTQGNRDFALNSVAWLNERDDQLSIRPRQNEVYQIAYLTGTQAKLIFAVTVVAFPLILLSIGAVLWWRRRRA